MRCIYTFVSMAISCATPALAQDVASGPELGKKVSALKVFDATGPHKDKELDYSGQRKGLPTIYAFVQSDKWDRPMARFMRKLDDAVTKEGKDVAVVAVWLTDNPDKTKEYLPRAQQSLQLQATALTCYTGEKSGPAGWNINSDAHLTVVLVDQGKSAKIFGYRSVNETNVPEVFKALRKLTGNK